ncbi:hypothetical protein [Sphingomonas sp. CFBP 8764]|nr:hypothetical protein [Sphingomonas sp. CFBP 8764]
MNIANILKAAFKVVKANPTLVIGAVGAISPIVKAVKAEAKKPRV